jgi:hypothetical protein
MSEIGTILGTSASTVKNQLQAVYKRLGTPNGTAAVVIALREGWIDFPPRERRMKNFFQARSDTISWKTP